MSGDELSVTWVTEDSAVKLGLQDEQFNPGGERGRRVLGRYTGQRAGGEVPRPSLADQKALPTKRN